MSKKLLFKGGHATGMIPFEIEDFSTLYMRDARVDEKTKAYIDSVIGNSVLNLCPYRNVLVTHKYDTVEGNVITLDDCQDDEVIQLSEIQGNTMVNCNKDTDKELILMPNLETNGYSNVTLTQGIDGGKVDVALEGNTMVNVCDQEEPVAITKNYEVSTGNHVALQGEYDGKCRPNIHGNTLVNLVGSIKSKGHVTISNNEITYDLNNNEYPSCTFNVNGLVNGKTYTIIIDIKKNSHHIIIGGSSNKEYEIDYISKCTTTGMIVAKFTIPDNGKNYNLLPMWSQAQNSNKELVVSCPIILEGDYTNKPIPDYFTGMKSSFEDKLITDEKDAHNGKYKVDYKVTGKNKCHIKDGNYTNTSGGLTWTIRDNQIQVNGTSTGTSSLGMSMCYPNFINGKTYVTSTSNSNVTLYISYIDNGTRKYSGGGNKTYTHNPNYTDIMCYLQVNNSEVTFNNEIIKCQIEEGTTATTYEPYKEYTKTLYLNSPLLEGDTIEQSGNDIVHMHRYKTVTFDGSDDEKWVYWGNNTDNGKLDSSLISFYLSFTNYKDFTTSTIFNNKFLMANTVWGATTEIMALNADNIMSFQVALLRSKLATQDLAGFKTWLQQNPITVVYELATPTQEVISTNDNLLLNSYVNGHLDVDSVIPIDKVVFQGNFNKSLRYLYPNTEYIIQFESNNSGKIDKLHLAGTNSDIFNVVKGVNKYTLTTGELSSKSIVINGIGFNMSKIVVTPKVEQPFGYFKGMKSVGECEGNKIEILSQNKNLIDNLIPYPITVVKNDREHNNGALLGVVKVKPNTTYIMSVTRDKKAGRVVAKMSNRIILSTELQNGLFTQDYIYNFLRDNYAHGRSFEKTLYSQDYIKFTTFSDCNYLYVNVDCNYNMDNNVTEVTISNVQIEEVKDTSTSPTTYTPHKQNKKEILLSEPLRGLPNGVKDKYVIIDGKWYIERNCEQVNMYELEFAGDTIDTMKVLLLNKTKPIAISNIFSNHDSFDTLTKGQMFVQERGGGLTYVWIPTDTMSNEEFKRFLNEQNTTIIFAKSEPTYEPIDYNPFEAYTDITHISNNSTIPCNMVIKNTGYNCILKPNTKYTVVTNTQGSISAKIGSTKVDSTSNVFTIITPSTLTDSILRFSGKGLTTKDIMLLEGDKTNYIPKYFTGMESAFEQEYDEEKNKYKVNVKVTDGNKENNITFYINEPLRGVGNVKDKVYVKEDKVVVERNCGSVTFDGSDDEEWVYWSDNTNNGKLDSSLISFYLSFTNYISANNEILIINDRFIPSNTVWASNTEKIALNGDKITSFQIACLRSKLTTQDVAGFRQWLQNNPTTVVYQLATPTYEEVECDLSKLALEGYENGTLFYDTNIPVTTQFYDFDVNIKDMLIPNETYYVTFNADRVKDITINLSGVQVNYKTSMGYNKVPIQLGDVVNTNFSMDSRGVELSDIMVSTSTSLIYVKDMNDVCVYDEASNKYSITITSTNGKESDKRVILLDYPLLRLNKDIYDRLYYSNKDSRYRIDKKVFKHKFTNDHEYSKYAAETNDTYYSSFISLNEAIKDYVVITNEKVKTVKVEDDKYYFKIKWSDLGVSDKTEANGNQGVKDFFNNNEVYLYYATDGFVEVIDELRRQTLKVYQPETFMKFLGNTTTTVTILIPMKNV